MATAATATTAESIGRNVSAEMVGTVLVLRVDTSKSQGPSHSGKSEILGTTGGASKLNGFAVNLNVYR
jgi:hypothetical protein